MALPAEIRDQVYRPDDGEAYNYEEQLGAKEVFGDDEESDVAARRSRAGV